MTAQEAKSISTINGDRKQKLFDKFKKEQDEEIEKAAKKGWSSAAWLGDYADYYVYYDELVRIYNALGYTIKPTGYIGGVLQKTHDICW